MRIYDQSSDTSLQQTYKLLHSCDSNGSPLWELPDYVKEAADASIVGNEALASAIFASPYDRLFPCHTKAATWVSSIFFYTQQSQLGEKTAELVEKRIRAAAKTYGIQDQVALIKQAAAKATAHEDTDDDFGVVDTDEQSGKSIRIFPVRTEKEVEKAARYLESQRDDIPFAYRVKIARKILERAEKFSVDLANIAFVTKEASLGFTATSRILDLLENRIKIASLARKQDPELLQDLRQLHSKISKEPAWGHVNDNNVKLACALEEVDEKLGVKNIAEAVPVNAVLFSVSQQEMNKHASETLRLTTGSCFDLGDIKKVPASAFSELFGSSFTDAVVNGTGDIDLEKVAAVVATFPRNDAELFERLLNSHGIEPVVKTASKRPALFDDENRMAEFIKRYRSKSVA